jgi:hypothetical protein
MLQIHQDSASNSFNDKFAEKRVLATHLAKEKRALKNTYKTW